MKRVHRLEGKPDETFSPTSNHSYWTPTPRRWRCMSVVFNGLVRIVGKQGRAYTYELTDAGRKLANAYAYADVM